MSQGSIVTETVEETVVTDEVVPFVEEDREIAYRAEAVASAPLIRRARCWS